MVDWKAECLHCLKHREQYVLLSSLMVSVLSLHDTEFIHRGNSESPWGRKQDAHPLSSALFLPGEMVKGNTESDVKDVKAVNQKSKPPPCLEGESLKWLDIVEGAYVYDKWPKSFCPHSSGTWQTVTAFMVTMYIYVSRRTVKIFYFYDTNNCISIPVCVILIKPHLLLQPVNSDSQRLGHARHWLKAPCV